MNEMMKELMKGSFLGSKGSVGHDLQAIETKLIPAGQSVFFTTQIDGLPSEEYFGLVCSRSGLAAKHGLFVLNSPGVIDSDYTGNIGVVLHNSTTEPYEVQAGDKIAQMIIFKRDILLGTEAPEKDRGDDGFGSTGR